MKKQIISFIFLLFYLIVSAQGNIAWDYPIKPGMKEWGNLKTNEQKLEVCQIPSDKLLKISTKELVELCFNYPLGSNYLAFDDERKAIKATISKFNGFQELSNRRDAIAELLKAYANCPITNKIHKESTSNGYQNPFMLSYIELVLSDSTFINKMEEKDLEELKVIAFDKYAKKAENSKVYSMFNIKKSMLLISVVLNKKASKGKSIDKLDVINTFIKKYDNLDVNTITEMSKVISGK